MRWSESLEQFAGCGGCDVTSSRLNVAEPAWDLLIELYFRDSIGASTTATQLKEAAYAPASAADCWLQHLEKEGFVRSKEHPTDMETEFIEMREKARDALESYLPQFARLRLSRPRRRKLAKVVTWAAKSVV